MNVKSTPELLDKKAVEDERPIFETTDESEYKITDKRGRTIIMRRPSPRTEIYFPTLFKPEETMNEAFMMCVRPFAYVIEVAGVKMPSITKKTDLDILIDILGHDGRNAIIKGWAIHFSKAELKEIEEMQDEIKKSQKMVK